MWRMSSQAYNPLGFFYKVTIFIYARVQIASLLRIVTDTNDEIILPLWIFQQYAEAPEFTVTNCWDVVWLNMNTSL